MDRTDCPDCTLAVWWDLFIYDKDISDFTDFQKAFIGAVGSRLQSQKAFLNTPVDATERG